jgi:hypothetical protein
MSVSSSGSSSKRALERGSVLGFKAFTGTIACEKGILWLSWRGSKDVVLAAGEKLELRRARSLLVQALKGAAEVATRYAEPRPGTTSSVLR